MLKTGLVIDYQNVHLTGANLFQGSLPLEDSLIDPLKFAKAIENKKNSHSDPAFHVDITDIRVFRGLPHASRPGYQKNLSAKYAWEQSVLGQPTSLEVTHRPLKYPGYYSPSGAWTLNYSGSAQEKGIDVLVALEVVRMARRNDLDAVILASQDTDLVPALEEAIALGNGKSIQAVKWFDPSDRSTYGNYPVQGLWTERLDSGCFSASLDTRTY